MQINTSKFYTSFSLFSIGPPGQHLHGWHVVRECGRALPRQFSQCLELGGGIFGSSAWRIDDHGVRMDRVHRRTRRLSFLPKIYLSTQVNLVSLGRDAHRRI